MSQRWEYRSSTSVTGDRDRDQELAKWAAHGWELVNASVTEYTVFYFWRRALS